MAALKFERFGGQIPALDDTLLPMENSAYSENAFLQSGALEPLAADIEIHVLANPIARFAFRVPIDSYSIDNIVDSKWLEFEDPDTSVVRGPVINTADGGRFYWASSSGPPGYTTKQRIIAGQPSLILGVPGPTVAPTIGAITGGAVPLQTRAYVYTWVTSLGEESQPSPPSEILSGNTGATWPITVTAPPGSVTANRLLATTRIYRTEVGTDGVTVDYFLVHEMPIATLTFNDSVPNDTVANSTILASIDWSPPPADLKGMVSMPNGMIAGWRDNEVLFCEPYRPHAWPVPYAINVDAPIVGLGTIGQDCMVLTQGQPWVASGTHPSVMTMRKVQPLEPCTAQGSIVATDQGVLYTSNNGLILIGPSGGRNLTQGLIRKDDWGKIINLRTIHATYFMNGYYAYSGATEGVFQADAFQVVDVPATPAADEFAFQAENFQGSMIGAHINLTDERIGLMTLTCTSPTYNVMLDGWTGETFVIRSGRVYHVDRREYHPRQSYKWRSKLVQMPYMNNFAAVKIFYRQPYGDVPAAEPTLFRYYVDSRLRYVRPVRKSGEQFRLPSGFKADTVQFELEGQLLIVNMQVATSPRELREV